MRSYKAYHYKTAVHRSEYAVPLQEWTCLVLLYTRRSCLPYFPLHSHATDIHRKFPDFHMSPAKYPQPLFQNCYPNPSSAKFRSLPGCGAAGIPSPARKQNSFQPLSAQSSDFCDSQTTVRKALIKILPMRKTAPPS